MLEPETGEVIEFHAEVFNLLNRANFATLRAGHNETARRSFAGPADVEAPLLVAAIVAATPPASRQFPLASKIVF